MTELIVKLVCPPGHRSARSSAHTDQSIFYLHEKLTRLSITHKMYKHCANMVGRYCTSTQVDVWSSVEDLCNLYSLLFFYSFTCCTAEHRRICSWKQCTPRSNLIQVYQPHTFSLLLYQNGLIPNTCNEVAESFLEIQDENSWNFIHSCCNLSEKLLSKSKSSNIRYVVCIMCL